MNKYNEKLAILKTESHAYFKTEFDSDEAEEKENVRIKSALLNLIQEVKESEAEIIHQEIKKYILDYLCEICGCSGDLEILKLHSPSIISGEELSFVIQNSALSRWL
jgi:excinuclease UvrABC ATPase subunit